MVRTGARAAVLSDLLEQQGHRRTAAPAAPRLATLSAEAAERVLGVYRRLGGTHTTPRIAPGSWDLAYEPSLLIELDEELHFNRFRRLTLESDWAAALPWRDAYLDQCTEHESACLAAGQWGARWANPSATALFGGSDEPGVFGERGPARWKQRALYDAMKDIASLDRGLSLVRLSVHDVPGGVRLGDALEVTSSVDPEALEELVRERTHVAASGAPRR